MPKNNTPSDIAEFLQGTRWESFDLVPMSADMGLRRYFRLEKGNETGRETALFMDMSRAGILETGLKEFIKVADFLRDNHVRVPDVYQHDLDTGYAVIENLGSTSFGDALQKGVPKAELYGYATDILMKIKQASAENIMGLEMYEDTLIRERLSQFVDYYMPVGARRETTQADQDEFQKTLEDIGRNLPPCPMGMCHADYHLENLMLRDDPEDPYAVIDFQNAFWGFQGYDLLNLLEDARATVPDEIKTLMKDLYCDGMTTEARKIFDDWYALLSCHFHFRVIGLFIKFARENDGKEFLEHIPRLQNYIKNNLKNPVLLPLKEFVERHNINFDISVT